MTTDRCERMWQVEALEDGRLEQKDRASFERHSQTCAACSAQLVRLRELHQLMLEAPVAERSELERRRARIALLGEANRRVVGRQAPTRKFRFGALAAVLLLLGLATFVLSQRLSSRNLPGFEVVNVAQSDWTAEKVGTTSRVTLRAGVASFHVEHVARGTRFLVSLPDGEIEVRGTRFVVDVAAGHTRTVVVTEGVVALRLAGAQRVLHPGERWQSSSNEASPLASGEPQKEPATKPALPSTAVANPVVSGSVMPEGNSVAPIQPGMLRPTERVSSLAPAPRGSAVGRLLLVDHHENEPTSSAKISADSAGSRFAEAVAAFSAGDYGRADSLFGAFAHDFPGDSRAEDAAFLRADARARRGDKLGAAAAARAYIQAYPKGLRRLEAERLAADH